MHNPLTSQNDWIDERPYDVNPIDNDPRCPPDVRQWQADHKYMKYFFKI